MSALLSTVRPYTLNLNREELGLLLDSLRDFKRGYVRQFNTPEYLDECPEVVVSFADLDAFEDRLIVAMRSQTTPGGSHVPA